MPTRGDKPEPQQPPDTDARRPPTSPSPHTPSSPPAPAGTDARHPSTPAPADTRSSATPPAADADGRQPPASPSPSTPSGPVPSATADRQFNAGPFDGTLGAGAEADGWGAAIRSALTTLTITPVRGPRSISRRTAGRAMVLAPAVGLLLAVVADLVVLLERVIMRGGGYQTLLPAVLGVATLAVLTRGLHLDGLADFADGLGASRDADRSLAVMKDPAVGAFGLVTVVFVLLVQVTALSTEIARHHGTVTLVAAAVTGRAAVTLACRQGVPAARPSGLGAVVAGSVSRPTAAATAVVSVVVVGLLGWADPDGGKPVEGALAAGAVVVGLLVAEVLRRVAVRRLGGITGDVLGAVLETGATAAMIVMTGHVTR